MAPDYAGSGTLHGMDTSSVRVRVDFVSDVVCPWCAIGLASLERALERVRGEVEVDLHFQPFELNPQLGPEGDDAAEHLKRKYGMDDAQVAANQEAIRARGAELGFTFDMARRRRIHNTFDAHRLLHWAGPEGRQHALKQALLRAYFTEGRDVSDHDTLAELAAEVGLDAARPRQVLASGEFAEEVRADEQYFMQAGIRAVPAIILERKHLVSGGQPPEVFEQALRQVAALKAPAR